MHCRGVRQGDPLSPLLFILAMEHLHILIRRAQQMRLLTRLSEGTNEYVISMYDDDAALFIAPSEVDFKTIKEIIYIFAAASDLQINVGKTEIYPIRCEATNLSYLTTSGMILSSFPYKSRGLPLHHKKSTKQMMQPVIQRIIDKLPAWKRRFLTYPRRELLVKTILSSMPTFFMIVHKMHK
jgi:hypothetical protein